MVHVQIAAYDGPLDLLLQLIAKAKIDIKDIFVSEITEQYLDVVRSMEVLDLESASDFLTMAATLLQIKSRSLLPRPEEDVDVEAEKQRLIQNLYEYQRLKQAAQELEPLALMAENNYYKLPDEYVFSEGEVVLESVPTDALVNLLEELLKERDFRETVRQPMEVVRTINIPLEDTIRSFRERIKKGKSILFRDLLSPARTKGEIIVGFLAILELISAGEICARQKEAFGDIVLDAVK